MRPYHGEKNDDTEFENAPDGVPEPPIDAEESQPTPNSGEAPDVSDEDPVAAARKWRPNWFLLALLPAIFLLLYVSHLPIQRSAVSIAYPYQLDREEGYVLYQAMELARGRTIYGPIWEEPYLVGNYPPVYPMIYAGMLSFMPPTLGVGRVIVAFSVLILVAILANLVAVRTRRIVPAALAVGLFLATWDLNEWIAYARVDLTAIALGLCGLAAMAWERRMPGLLAGCALFALAFFTKQTQVILPMAVALALVWRGEYARAGAFCMVLGALIATVLTGLSLATAGQLWHHTVLYNINEMVPGQLNIWLRHIWFFGAWKLIAVGLCIAIAAVIVLKRGRERIIGRPSDPGAFLLPASVVFTILSGLSIYTIAKAGAASNYLLEFHVACALLVGLVVGEVADLIERTRVPDAPASSLRWVAIALSVLLVATLSLHGWRTFERRGTYYPAPQPELAQVLAYIDIEVGATAGDILSEEPIFTIRAGRPVLYQPFIMSQLSREGQWEQENFVEQLLSGRFELIVATEDLREEGRRFQGFTEEMAAAVRKSYRLYRQIAGYYLFVPRESERSASQDSHVRRATQEPEEAPRFDAPVLSATPGAA